MNLDGRLSQSCRCGGRGYMFRCYDRVADGTYVHIGYSASCEVCGATTDRFRSFRETRKAWLDRDCPHTYSPVDQ